jgi:hypothetical protein
MSDTAAPGDPDVVEDTVLVDDEPQPVDDADPVLDVAAESSAPVDARADAMPVYPDTVPVDARADASSDARDAGTDVRDAGTDVRDAGTDVRDAGTDARDAGTDARDASSDGGSGCRSTADCDDGLADTIDGCEIASGICRHERCDDGNPCTANVATEHGCLFPVLPDGTSCRPGPLSFTCRAGVCPPCGGENEVCCEWPGSTNVCSGAARCRTTAAGFRRCITCGGSGQRCCSSSDDVTVRWASQRCNPGLTCSSIPGVAGTCR